MGNHEYIVNMPNNMDNINILIYQFKYIYMWKYIDNISIT